MHANQLVKLTEIEFNFLVDKSRELAEYQDYGKGIKWSRSSIAHSGSPNNYHKTPLMKTAYMMSMLLNGIGSTYIANHFKTTVSTVTRYAHQLGFFEEYMAMKKRKYFKYPASTLVTFKQDQVSGKKVLELAGMGYPMSYISEKTGLKPKQLYHFLKFKNPKFYNDYLKMIDNKAFPLLSSSKEMDDKYKKKIDEMHKLKMSSGQMSRYFLDCDDFETEIPARTIASYLLRVGKIVRVAKKPKILASAPPKEASYENSEAQMQKKLDELDKKYKLLMAQQLEEIKAAWATLSPEKKKNYAKKSAQLAGVTEVPETYETLPKETGVSKATETYAALPNEDWVIAQRMKKLSYTQIANKAIEEGKTDLKRAHIAYLCAKHNLGGFSNSHDFREKVLKRVDHGVGRGRYYHHATKAAALKDLANGMSRTDVSVKHKVMISTVKDWDCIRKRKQKKSMVR